MDSSGEPRGTWIRRLARYAVVTAAGWGALSLLARRSVFHPIKYPEGWWQLQERVGAEDAWITTRDGVKLHGWFASPPEAKLATLFLHGNAGNVTHRVQAILAIREAGSAVLVLDYRGFGKSEGSPSESGVTMDAEAAFVWLQKRGFPPKRIVLHGESLGTAVAVDLATRNQCAGLVLEAPLTSASAVAGTVVPLLGRTLISGFDSLSRISRVKAPLLVIHGTRDEVIPFRMGQELFDAANEPKQFWAVEGAGHNNISETAGPAYAAKLKEFLGSLASRMGE
ncbi:MAG TPA: alpha/beta hydrolase [Bryobacteraceae bacterium]|nr:alpha/beta hydrolase [Bryobacteraceae bacterium]